MKKVAITVLSVMLVGMFVVAMTGIATAAASSDTNKLNAEIMMLNHDAKLPQAENAITKQLTDTFSVPSSKISSLISKNLQYGETAAVLAFADKMPGGITDANINQVVSMRSQGGWDQVAKNVKVDLSGVASKLGSIEDAAHRNIKQALAESPYGGAGAGGGGVAGGMTGGTGTMGNYPQPGMSGGATGGTGTMGNYPEPGVSGGGAGGTETEEPGAMPESSETGSDGAEQYPSSQ